MIKRLIVITVVILAGLIGLCALGLHSLRLHAAGLEGRRLAEFAAVAEQIRVDVKRKLDAFIQTEQARPYTEYLYYYVPTATAAQAAEPQTALVRSPLANRFSNGLAYGYFQIDPDGTIVTPYVPAGALDTAEPEVRAYIEQALRKKLRAHLRSPATGVRATEAPPAGPAPVPAIESAAQPPSGTMALEENHTLPGPILPSARTRRVNEQAGRAMTPAPDRGTTPLRGQAQKSAKSAPKTSSQMYRIGSLAESQQVQVVVQDRALVEQNVMNYATRGGPDRFMQQQAESAGPQRSQSQAAERYAERQQRRAAPRRSPQREMMMGMGRSEAQSPPRLEQQADQPPATAEPVRATVEAERPSQPQTAQRDVPPGLPNGDAYAYGAAQTVAVRIEPFVPVMVPATAPDVESASKSLAAGQDTVGASAATIPPFGYDVYLVRHVQVETEHFVQGFQLDQRRLLAEVRDSADRLMRAGMGYQITTGPPPNDAGLRHTAILDFGFGSLTLGLLELDPGWIDRQLAALRRGYLGVMGLVSTATMLALAALWANVRAQVALARKKDDFISAVSHELRTPLTSIRMYTEMLEKDWIRDDAKRGQYYGHMRHETERLSRLIENVLDFSRIQRGRKRYRFQLGDLNACIRQAVTMMQPCAAQAGFEIVLQPDPIPPFEFDPDAVVQIVVNLVDNAIKYAADAADRTIYVRTRSDGSWAVIEVEDRGPGIPRRQRARVFDAFYRLGDESRRETTGTGLGLALVKRFTEAHAGTVEILAAKPRGALLRVRLAVARPA